MVQAKISARYTIYNILNILGSYDNSLIEPVMLVIETIMLYTITYPNGESYIYFFIFSDKDIFFYVVIPKPF